MTAIVVLGMHRSGTSCVAGMVAAAGIASAGEAVRNWDNARGHHEMLDLIRLDEAVLAACGGHWLAAPAAVRWTDDHAAARDRLLAARVDGRPALLKDPRMLLVLPLWRAAAVPMHVVAVIRHPLAVARSLASWRGVPLDQGVALWIAHNRVLAGDHARHGEPVIDFGRDRAEVIAAVVAALRAVAEDFDADAIAAAYHAELVHHDDALDDGGGDGDGDAGAGAVPGLDDAIALYRQLGGGRGGGGATTTRPRFPRKQLAAFAEHLRAGDVALAVAGARAALGAAGDAAAVLVPIVGALVRHRALAEARTLVGDFGDRLDAGLADLLHGKVLLALRDPAGAARHLEAACAVPRPYHQARALLPHALRAARRPAEARAALREVAAHALYPHGPLATLAEWTWRDGDRPCALAEMADAIAAAPRHRRGRLRTRRATWLVAVGDPAAARAELELALDEDPTYPGPRELLVRLSAQGA